MGEPDTFHGMRVITDPNLPHGHPGMVLSSEDVVSEHDALLCRYWATGIVRRALGLPCGGSVHSVEATFGHIAEVAER